MNQTEEHAQGGDSFLKTIREMLGGVSQEQFAHMIGVTSITVSRWERGQHPATFTVPQMKKFVVLLDSLGLGVTDIPDDLTQPLAIPPQRANDTLGGHSQKRR